MSGLREILTRRIRSEGPMSVAEYMALCLTHPEHGYYMHRDPLGAGGDFVTAPEISQMFGELIGLGMAQYWTDLGSPDPFVLAELGPGRGTLMADALRAARAVPGFIEAARLVLIEASPALRAQQNRRLEAYRPGRADGMAALPELPLLLVANEFFDALPVRQFVRAETGWAERVIGLRQSEDALNFGLSPPARLETLEPAFAKTAPGEIVETCAGAAALAHEIGLHIERLGGLALIIDYGGEPGRGDSLQAVRGHRKVDPLATPGEADLTAHVDFAALAGALPAGAVASKPTPQGVFLERLGITARARDLASNLTGAALETHIAAHRRLTHPEEMGKLFKVMAITGSGAPVPPGTDP